MSNGQRPGGEIHVRPSQPANLTLAQTRQRQVPRLGQAVTVDMRQQLARLVFGERGELLPRPLEPIYECLGATAAAAPIAAPSRNNRAEWSWPSIRTPTNTFGSSPNTQVNEVDIESVFKAIATRVPSTETAPASERAAQRYATAQAPKVTTEHETHCSA